MRAIILLCAILVPVVGLYVSENLAIAIAILGVVVFELYLARYTRAVECLTELLGEEAAESRERSFKLLVELDNRFVEELGAAAIPSASAYRLFEEPLQVRARLQVVWKPFLPKDEDGDDDWLVWMPCRKRMICFRHFFNGFHAWLLVHGSPNRSDSLGRLVRGRGL